jgi:hypothetical protein
MADLGGDGRVIGLPAALRRASERLLGDDAGGGADPPGAERSESQRR